MIKLDIKKEFDNSFMDGLRSILPEGVTIIETGQKILLKVGEEVILEEGLQFYHQLLNDETIQNKFFDKLLEQIESNFDDFAQSL